MDEIWYKVLDDEKKLMEGRVMSVVAGTHDVCLTRYQGVISALDNKCPHQGGPLGEGSIENGMLRCPWHGWDFHPCTGKSPGSFGDGVSTYEIKIEKGVVYVKLPSTKVAPSTISDIMVETMVNWGIEAVFGMVGHSNLGISEAFRHQEKKGRLTYIGIRHEGAASFAASAYGKLMGKPAVCFSIAGPGATNMYTGMWDAKVDRAPLLALTGQVATQVVGTGNFQELDLVRAFQTVAAFNHQVQVNSQHSELMGLAIKHAILQRDVSHLTFPDEVQFTSAGSSKVGFPKGRMVKPMIAPSEESVLLATKAISTSSRPVIIVGYGARFCMPQIIQMAETLNCPIITTFKGKSLIPDSHPLAGGVLGRSGTPIASWLMNESDLLIVLGASFSNHTGISPKKKTIQIDYDSLAIAKFHPIDIPVWGEISLSLSMIEGNLKEIKTQDQRKDIAERWLLWRREKEIRHKEYCQQGLHSVQVFSVMSRCVPHDAVICVDVGNNAYSFGRYYESKHNSILMSGYLGSIGFGLPASIGAAVGVKNKRPVVAVVGDGGIGQYLSEITTLSKYQLPIKIILINNNELGKISKEQRALDQEVWQTQLVNPNFSTYAETCGLWSRRVNKPSEIEKAMEETMSVDGPALLEIMTDVKLV